MIETDGEDALRQGQRRANELPPDFPKSSLKGISPGPVTITTWMFPGDRVAVVTIELSPRARVLSEVDDLWPLAVTALAPLVSDPGFEVAAIRVDSLGSDETFDPDPPDGPVIVVCGPAASERRDELAESATGTIDAGPLTGLRFACHQRRIDEHRQGCGESRYVGRRDTTKAHVVVERGRGHLERRRWRPQPPRRWLIRR